MSYFPRLWHINLFAEWVFVDSDYRGLWLLHIQLRPKETTQEKLLKDSKLTISVVNIISQCVMWRGLFETTCHWRLCHRIPGQKKYVIVYYRAEVILKEIGYQPKQELSVEWNIWQNIFNDMEYKERHWTEILLKSNNELKANKTFVRSLQTVEVWIMHQIIQGRNVTLAIGRLTDSFERNMCWWKTLGHILGICKALMAKVR